MIMQQAELVSEQQLSLLRELKMFESSLQIHSLTEIPLNSSGNLQSSQSHFIKQRDLYKSSESVHLQSSISNLKQSLNFKHSSSTPQPNNHHPHQQQQPTTLLFINTELHHEGTQMYTSLKQQLISYKQKSQQVYKVGEFIKAYEQNFTFLIREKDSLLSTLTSIKGETSQLVDKQKKLIDLSIAVKQSLDYYTYHQKNPFNYACEISSRQLFEDSLQSTLSTVMDGIQFFEENQTFVQAKKQLNIYLASKSKILSFVKSFLIKLLNKENAFAIKHLNHNKIDTQLNALYPKSRVKLLSDFLLTFPHLKKDLKDILLTVKDQNHDNEQKQAELNFLEIRQLEIDEFILTESNVSLIRYLEKHNYELYSEVMLNLFTFNRLNFHQNFIFNWARRLGNDSASSQERDKEKERLKQFKSKLYFVIQTVISEYVYFQLCCHPSTPQSIEFITAWLYKLVQKYLEVLVKEVREFVVKFKFNPFELCEQIDGLVEKELAGYFENLSKEQYQSYVIGCLWQSVNGKNASAFKVGTHEQNFHAKQLKDLFANSLKPRLLSQLSQFCLQALPKLQLSQTRQQVQQNINKLIYFIPKLQYCTNNADSYMISSLDILIKSIKQVNHTIDSRFECYSWNLLLFGVVRNILHAKQLQVVSKEIRLDFNDSLNIIDRVKQLDRPESLIKYAQDIFNVIKTGMPSLNQLTLDFNQYVDEHYQELESRFLKDILFIYAKNMVEFLQNLIDAKKKLTSQKSIQQNHQNHLQQSHQNHLQQTHSQQHQETTISEFNVNSQKSISDNQPENHTQSSQSPNKSPKGQKKSPRPTSELQRMCDSTMMKSLYNSYLLSIEKYIGEAREMMKMVEESTVERKEGEIRKVRELIREVYEKMFDFLDTFYVAVSEVNSEVTAEFEEISTIKEKQETLWMGK